MLLPDVARLGSVPAQAWSALGRRLRDIGVTAAAAVPFARLAALSPDPRRPALAKWHLRRIDEPYALALRMLMFWDPIPPDQARAVLGEALPVEALVDAGLLEHSDGGVVSTFVLQLVADLYVLSDDVRAGGDAVMGAAPSTRSLAAVARPTSRARRALDLGCGAGTLALSMAAMCEQVIATDVNERAVELARVNGALNGRTNIEHRVGDLFAPILGESFDVIACQPPFVARDETDGPAAFLFGGPRGDELALRVLEGVGAHLAPEGMAFVMAEWPVVEDDRPLDERIVQALGSPELSVLVLQSPGGDLDAHCARYASVTRDRLDDEYESATLRRREHFERLRVRALQPALAVVRRGPRELSWASTVDTAGSPMSRARVEAMLAARDLLSRGSNALLEARLRLPEGARGPASAILTLVDGSDSVRTAVAHHAAATGRAAADVSTEVVACVTDALLAERLLVRKS
jgi:SAM-dependent methyltransferase